MPLLMLNGWGTGGAAVTVSGAGVVLQEHFSLGFFLGAGRCCLNSYPTRLIRRTRLHLLSRGLNFAPSPRRIPIPQIITAVESALQKTSNPVESDKVIMKVSQMISRGNVPHMNMTPSETKALKELRLAKDILILPAGKGRSTVVID